MFNKIKEYLSLMDVVFQNFIEDLGSFRVQILYIIYIFNLICLWAIIYKQIDYKILAISFGGLTIILGYFFKSKSDQAKMENDMFPEDSDPKVDRNPDEE